MKEGERYKRTMEKKMASSEDLKYFVLEILQQEGLDPAIVNFKEEGITIQAFNKLVRAVYEVGYKDGLEQHSNILGKKREMERKGKALIHHKRLSEHFKETAIIQPLNS